MRSFAIEVEVENQNDAILVAQLGVTIIMLDNFTPKDIKKTIKKMKELKNMLRSGELNQLETFVVKDAIQLTQE